MQIRFKESRERVVEFRLSISVVVMYVFRAVIVDSETPTQCHPATPQVHRGITKTKNQ